MSMKLDLALAQTGTRFRLFPLPRYVDPTIEVEVGPAPVPPAAMQAGPADSRMFVSDAINKLPYVDSSGPPYRGPANDPVKPGPTGHFDHLEPGSREFLVATMYATVRRVLDL